VAVPKLDVRRLLRRLLVLCGLGAVAFVWPVLDLYGRNPEVFVANRTSGAQIVLFALLVTLVFPLLALAVLAVTELIHPRAAGGAYLVLITLTGIGTGLVVSRQVVPDSDVPALVVAAVVAALVVLVHRSFQSGLRWFGLALPLLLVLFLGFSATSNLIWAQASAAEVEAGSVGNPKSIVFLQLDEFPLASIVTEDGTVNEALFPNLARLAATGTWYRNALSASIATTQSVPAALTGVRGGSDLAPTAADHPNTLFTLLGDAYEMHVIEWVLALCPGDVCPDYAGQAPARFVSLLSDVGVVYGHLSLPKSTRDHLPSIDNSWQGFLRQEDQTAPAPVAVADFPVPAAGRRGAWIDRLQRIINGIAADAPPTLSYAHLETPHVPWQVNPSGTHYDRPEQYTEVDGVDGSGKWILDPRYARLGLQRHLYQLGFFDAMLGSLLDELEATGTWDDTMVILTADHGASFVPGEHRRWPYENNRDDLYRVPMFVKYPDQTTGEVRDEPAFNTDLLPTIVDVLDIDTDWTFDGISLLDLAGTDRPHEIIHWCCSSQGASTDLAVLFDQVARNHDWIPDQSTWLGVAAVGPHRDLVGRPSSELTVTPTEELRWSFEYDDGLSTVSIDTGIVQTLVTGRIDLPAAVAGDDLLVTVNGVVAGTGFVARDTPTGGEFRALVAEELLTEGANEVAILVPAPNGNGWLTGAADDLDVEYVADDGHVLDLKPEGNRRVQVDRVTATSTGWTLVGWGADVSAKVPPDRVYVFAGDDLIAFGAPNTDNPNVVRWYSSDALLRSGFSYDIDAASVPAGVERLTVVAEFGDYAIGEQAVLTE
jgi:hypothetical protein